jgi:hypothetical protein
MSPDLDVDLSPGDESEPEAADWQKPKFENLSMKMVEN